MGAQTDSLSRNVFEVIADHLKSEAPNISRFVHTGYSFEEWLNWEAFAACSQVKGWKVDPKPAYCSFGVEGCKDIADLLITAGDSKLVVEIGLAHDHTQNKWLLKLDRDAEKLRRELGGVQTLHLIILTSKDDIEGNKVWEKWLLGLHCWKTDNIGERKIQFSPSGQMIVRRWAINAP
jgi:hypothetical protein